jgi:hypothetical protein
MNTVLETGTGRQGSGMKAKRILIGAVLIIVTVKLLSIAIAAVSFYVMDRTNGTIVSAGVPAPSRAR